MIPKLQYDDRIQNDILQYQDKISAVTDTILQAELVETLLKLKDQIVYLDQYHEQIFVTGRVPSEIPEIRSKVAKYRKDLDQKLAHWKQYQLITPALRPNGE